MTEDRRKPVARYVLFSDESTQVRFAEIAETAFRDMSRLDQWAGKASLAVGDPEAATEKRGFLRRAARSAPQPDALTVTAGLAAAGEAGRDVPARIASLRGCHAEHELATRMGRVVLELARDLAGEPVDDQREHPAYRQTLRLAAELQAVHTVLEAVGCQSSAGCVRTRPPEQWGRRVEDVEVAEVRAVLLELAQSGTAEEQL
jgi:hypothetical protein